MSEEIKILMKNEIDFNYIIIQNHLPNKPLNFAQKRKVWYLSKFSMTVQLHNVQNDWVDLFESKECDLQVWVVLKSGNTDVRIAEQIAGYF